MAKESAPKKSGDKNKTKKDTVRKVSLVTKDQWLAAVKAQYEWSRNAVYAWIEGPNVQNSKKKNTCISLHSVALQRIGYLKSGKYFYFNPKKKKIWGNARSYVKDHTELFAVSYPNKTIKWLWKNGKIQIGDMVGYGDPGYHSMVFLGMRKNKKGNLVTIFATMGHKRGYGVTYPSYAGRKVNMLVHIKIK